MITDKIKKIQAFKKLMEISKNGSVDLYHYVDDFHKGARFWPVEWNEDLGNGRFENEEKRQYALDRTLENLTHADNPDSVAQLEKEKNLIRLLLDAGANPNHYYDYHGQNIFDDFLIQEKTHMALEIAKTDGFNGSEKPEKTFNELAYLLRYYLEWKTPFPGQEWEQNDKEKQALYAQKCSDQKELVCTLFDKNMFPRDRAVFEKLVPVVLEKEPDFFNKKKEQMVKQLKHAKTPTQIFSAFLVNQQKEKN